MIQRKQIIFQRSKIQSYADIKKAQKRKAMRIYLNNNHLEQVDEIKNVDIITDSKFKFTKHIQYINDRRTKPINALSKSARIHWGLRQEALEKMYNGALLPQLLYAAPV